MTNVNISRSPHFIGNMDDIKILGSRTRLKHWFLRDRGSSVHIFSFSFIKIWRVGSGQRRYCRDVKSRNENSHDKKKMVPPKMARQGCRSSRVSEFYDVFLKFYFSFFQMKWKKVLPDESVEFDGKKSQRLECKWSSSSEVGRMPQRVLILRETAASLHQK